MPHHESEKENLKRLLLHYEPNIYEDILKVFEVFQSIDDHVTIEELKSKLKDKGIELDNETLKEYMAKIIALGFATKKDFQDQPTKYEHRHIGFHHDHLICVRCGKIVEFEDQELENLQQAIAKKYGFNIIRHRMEMYGLCNNCKSKMERTMPLPLAKPGERYVIKDIMGGRMARLRLFSMGLRPGDEVEVISDSFGDGLIVARGETRIAVGKGIANKILVTLKSDGDSILSSTDKGQS